MAHRHGSRFALPNCSVGLCGKNLQDGPLLVLHVINGVAPINGLETWGTGSIAPIISGVITLLINGSGPSCRWWF